MRQHVRSWRKLATFSYGVAAGHPRALGHIAGMPRPIRCPNRRAVVHYSSAKTGPFSLVVQDAGVDAVQATIHSELQLIGILSTHPVSQFLDRDCPSSTIFLEHFKERARPLQPPSNGVSANVVGYLVWHGVPSAHYLGPRGTRAPDPKAHRRCLNCTLRALPHDDALREKIRSILNGRIEADRTVETKHARPHIPEPPSEVGPLKGFSNDCVTPSRASSITDGQCMFVPRMTRRKRRASPRVAPVAEWHAGNDNGELDPAAVILYLEMAALIRQAGDSLRQHSDDADQRKERSWWRRLLGKKHSGEIGWHKTKKSGHHMRVLIGQGRGMSSAAEADLRFSATRSSSSDWTETRAPDHRASVLTGCGSHGALCSVPSAAPRPTILVETPPKKPVIKWGLCN
jgi:hypothetical protein